MLAASCTEKAKDRKELETPSKSKGWLADQAGSYLTKAPRFHQLFFRLPFCWPSYFIVDSAPPESKGWSFLLGRFSGQPNVDMPSEENTSTWSLHAAQFRFSFAAFNFRTFGIFVDTFLGHRSKKSVFFLFGLNGSAMRLSFSIVDTQSPKQTFEHQTLP